MSGRLGAFAVALCVAGVALLGTKTAFAQDGDGSVLAWGNDILGQCSVPAPNSGFVAIAASSYQSLGLKTDGSIMTWGGDTGQPPAPNSGFVAVAAGGNCIFDTPHQYILGLKSDGSIVAWGSCWYGQCDVPAPNNGFAAVAAGVGGGYEDGHSLGLKADGSVVAWGVNRDGQCDVPAPNSDFFAIAAGAIHSLGLKADGSIVTWGNNGVGQCDVPAPNSGFVAVAAGGWHSLGLKADGVIVAWGLNNAGQCDVPVPNSDFVAIAAGGTHNLGLKADGSIVAWGYHGWGQCDVPAPNSGFVAVAAGFEHSLGLKAVAPTVTNQSLSHTSCVGEGTSFTVMACGAPPLNYQWRKEGQPITGATGTSLSIDPVGLDDAGSYDVVVTNSYGAATSRTVVLFVDLPPVIAEQPQSQTQCVGQPATFSLTAGDTAPLSYQWRKNGINISGATGRSYSIDAVSTADAGSYDCVVAGAHCSVTSAGAVLTIKVGPAITEHPQGLAVSVPSSANFAVVASGIGTLTYQWCKGGQPLTDGGRISGATTNTLRIDPTWMSDSGSYDVVVTDDCGPVTSGAATLTVMTLKGDVNCDGIISYADINPFVLALSWHSEYVTQYPNCDWMLADCNQDGYVDYGDINPFVRLLSGAQ